MPWRFPPGTGISAGRTRPGCRTYRPWVGRSSRCPVKGHASGRVARAGEGCSDRAPWADRGRAVAAPSSAGPGRRHGRGPGHGWRLRRHWGRHGPGGVPGETDAVRPERKSPGRTVGLLSRRRAGACQGEIDELVALIAFDVAEVIVVVVGDSRHGQSHGFDRQGPQPRARSPGSMGGRRSPRTRTRRRSPGAGPRARTGARTRLRAGMRSRSWVRAGTGFRPRARMGTRAKGWLAAMGRLDGTRAKGRLVAMGWLDGTWAKGWLVAMGRLDGTRARHEAVGPDARPGRSRPAVVAKR